MGSVLCFIAGLVGVCGFGLVMLAHAISAALDEAEDLRNSTRLDH